MLIPLMVILLVAVYAGVLATISVSRDATLTAIGKTARLLGVWLIPLVGALFALRSTYDLYPSALPSARWLLPLKPLLYVRRRLAADTSSAEDLFQASNRQLPGQSFHKLD